MRPFEAALHINSITLVMDGTEREASVFPKPPMTLSGTVKSSNLSLREFGPLRGAQAVAAWIDNIYNSPVQNSRPDRTIRCDLLGQRMSRCADLVPRCASNAMIVDLHWHCATMGSPEN